MASSAPPAALLQRALHLAQLGRLDDAVPLVQQVLAAEPENVAALQVLAYCLERAGRYDRMLPVVQQAVALAPTDPAGHRQRARALLGLGRTREAADAAREAHALDPRDVRNDLALAEALLAAGGTGNIVAAAAATARARRLAPEEPAAHLLEGDVQRRMAEFGRAGAAYRRALALAPESAPGLFRLASLDADRGRALRASPLLGDTLRVAPNDPLALTTATAGARRALWLLTDVACLPLVAGAVTAGALRDEVAGPAGAVGATVVLTVAVVAAVAFLRWRLGRLSAATRTLIRRNLRRFTFATAPARLVSIVLGGLLLVVSPESGPDATPPAVALPMITVPVLLLLLRARNWFAAELYYLVRRGWFRLHRPGR